ncbi:MULTISPECIES: FAD-dependent protein [unclassified Arcicella]|uniref:NAD(P)/FAD-dependent oxidoreductase n=1 Tax=unclassified Arcicella TaxID=2644986 RepID=UPI0028621B89|nr:MULTISPECIES: FAD-binding protein [unclassified Arcicella]MDR6561615.1 putative FAD-dependent dehydrogenase [Arcicella sp. BE51]MDR6812395.1 putative FAD-dependent dehydrogenase [Arcicella sp. BE140]MDR6823833.1 putative FAD-dependent dehydrogenase [Arcicella sp. BE139]
MKKHISLVLEPEIAFDQENFKNHLSQLLHFPADADAIIRPLKRSIDARGRQVKVNIEAEVFLDETPPSRIAFQKNYQDVSKAQQAIIVGAGPAGLFAALRMIELGVKPILLERGKDVRARRRDLAAINKEHIVNPESNYCFGEGGAGTYSDGKLYTRSKKRGDIRRVLEIFVAHGATEEILVDAHPHIGTNKLPQLVADLRESILKAGGEVHFNTKVVDFIIQQKEIRGVVLEDGREISGIGVILATGHSARDIFELCQKRDVLIESKPYAMGVRIEHPQSLIDSLQYNCKDRGKYLPAASYSLVAQTFHKGVQRGVFSFCMCPGGFIVPAATAPGELVVNGMSPSRRDSHFANSGMVVAINEIDVLTYKEYGALAGLQLQRELEQKACQMTGGGQTAPAQLVHDFIKQHTSKNLLETSYQPGLQSMDMLEVLPDFIGKPLQDGLQQFGKKMRNYASNQGQIIGIESRTSSPVRIPRDKENLEHLTIKRLYPCGEGAGYAGGIMSAAMDGERCAEKLIENYAKN